MKNLIMIFVTSAVCAAVLAFFSSVTVIADVPERLCITDDMFISAAEESLNEKRGSDGSLCRKFIDSGQAAQSEADWYVLCEYALGFEDCYDEYIAAAQSELMKKLEDPQDYYLTELARTSAVISACGGKAPDLRIDDSLVENAGDNEVIWLVIAQRLGGYEYGGYEEELLSRQNEDGGFGFNESDPDVTAMALIALSDGGSAAEDAIGYLSEYYSDNAPDISTETAVQTLIGLCAQGISPASGNFVTSEGVRLTDILFSRRVDGGFSHMGEDGPNAMSTMQALTSLAALGVFDGENALLITPGVRCSLYEDENLAKEAFDDYDVMLAEDKTPVSASDFVMLSGLAEKARMFGTDENTVKLIEQRLSQSQELCDKIENINYQIRESFYPSDKAKIADISSLEKLNAEISGFADCDRRLILGADELSERESELRRNRSIAVVSGVVVLIGISVYFIRRKKKV